MNQLLLGLIYCAGKGTRLMPYTKTIPKPILLKYKNKTFLEINIERLINIGVEHIYINYSYGLNYYTEIVKKYKEQITLIYENEPIGHGKTIYNLKNTLKNNSYLLAMNGDTISDIDITDSINKVKKDDIDFTILTNNEVDDENCLLADKESNLTGCRIKKNNYFYTENKEDEIKKNNLGEYIFKTDNLDPVYKEGKEQDFLGFFGENDIAEIMIKNKKNVKCLDVLNNQYISVNTIEEFNKFNSLYNN